jgi:Family of unknown function (DUF6313)
MSELIPRLDSLCYRNGFSRIPASFAVTYVKLHDEDWRAAQNHWERVVARVLDTDVVDPEADGKAAMSQAVGAAAILLDRIATRHGRCPLCVRSPVLAAPPQRPERGRA